MLVVYKISKAEEYIEMNKKEDKILESNKKKTTNKIIQVEELKRYKVIQNGAGKRQTR